jgi:hypothetical protein
MHVSGVITARESPRHCHTFRRSGQAAHTFVVHDQISIAIIIETPNGAQNEAAHRARTGRPSCTDFTRTRARVEHATCCGRRRRSQHPNVGHASRDLRRLRSSETTSERGSCPGSRPSLCSGSATNRDGFESALCVGARPARAPVRSWICCRRNAHTQARRKHGMGRSGTTRLGVGRRQTDCFGLQSGLTFERQPVMAGLP